MRPQPAPRARYFMLQVGFGVGDITPKDGMDMPGGFYRNPSQGVLDNLLPTACVAHDGKTSLALVGVDALAVPKSVVEAAREKIARSTKIPAANVLIGANHTHSGGPTVGVVDSGLD